VARRAQRDVTEGAQGRYNEATERASSHTHKRAQAMRQAMSPPEVLLWTRLRVLRGEGPRFRRQHPIGPYIGDFFCSAARLVVEVDGSIHTDDAQIAHDERRDAYMGALGFEVIRAPAGEIMRNADEAADGVVQAALALTRKAR
jgi:very-short-patch-repair endonuclease